MITHKIELVPNNKQITYFKKACGLSRLAWNWGLFKWLRQLFLMNLNKKIVKSNRYVKLNEINNSSFDKVKNWFDLTEIKITNGFSLKKEFNSIKKKEFPFCFEVTKYATQQPFIQLQIAFKKYFNKETGKPKFKGKNNSRDSFYIGGEQIKIEGKKVIIPKLGKVKLRENIRFQGKIISATISRIVDKWFISFTIEPFMSYYSPCENQASVGIDLGIKKLATLSNGTFIRNLKPLKSLLTKLQKESRKLSKKQHPRFKGDKTPKSNNYNKQKIKVQKIQRRISNIRCDFLHKITTYLTDNFQYISIEDLAIKNMMKNKKLSRAIADVGMFEFKRQLIYKAKNKGNTIIINSRTYPSSKICPNCKNIKKELTLKDRVYECTECKKVKADRDYVASINLHNKIGEVQTEFKPLDILVLNQKARLIDITDFIKEGIKH